MPDDLFPRAGDGSGSRGRPDGTSERAEQALRRVFAAQAAGASPGPAPRVGELADRSRPRRWPAALGVAAAVAALAVTSAVALRPDTDPAPVAGPSQVASASPTPSSEPSGPPSDAPSTGPSPAPTGSTPAIPATPTATAATAAPTTTGGTPAATTSVIVWACLDSDDGQPTVRPERRAATPATGTGMSETEVRVAAAVDLLDTRPAVDPEYTNFWAPETQDAPPAGRTTVSVGDAGTTVAFSGSGLSGLATGATVGCLTETLVRTVVSNGGTAPVTYLLDGEPAAFAELDLSEPARPSVDALASGWILDPYEGQRVRAGTVTLSGTATAFEATVGWAVLDEGGAVVAEGFTMAGANGEYGPWTVPVDLVPGSYTAVVWEDNMAGDAEGPGPRIWEDTKSFTVVP